MAHEHCINKLTTASNGSLTADEARKILDEVADFDRRVRQEGDGIGAEAKVREFAATSAEAKRIEAAQAQRHAVINAVKFEQGLAHLDSLRAQSIGELDAFRALFHGLNQRAKGVRASAQRMLGAYEKKYLGTLMSEIAKEPGLEDALYGGWLIPLGILP